MSDDSISRRIIIIPFNNIFTSIDDHRIPFDIKNKNHKIRDFNLKENLLSSDKQKQLLVWLVKGSIKWFKYGLSTTPSLIRQAFCEYYNENDYVTFFINDYCNIDKKLSVSITKFRKCLMKEKNVKIKQEELKKIMEQRGFRCKKTNGYWFYIGIDLLN